VKFMVCKYSNSLNILKVLFVIWKEIKQLSLLKEIRRCNWLSYVPRLLLLLLPAHDWNNARAVHGRAPEVSSTIKAGKSPYDLYCVGVTYIPTKLSILSRLFKELAPFVIAQIVRNIPYFTYNPNCFSQG
jgi:hypothetical protein